MHEPDRPQPTWHQKPWMRAILFLLLPLLAVGLYLITTRIALHRPIPEREQVPQSNLQQIFNASNFKGVESVGERGLEQIT